MTMKSASGFLSKAISVTSTLCALLYANAAQAALTAGPGFAVESYYTHTDSSTIISYDRDAGNQLYYMTGYASQDVWKATGASPTNIFHNSSLFSGASVVAIGDYIYFNDSNIANIQFIRGYGPLSGAPTVTQFSTTTNYALFGNSGQLYITGGPFGNDHIYYSNLAVNGDLLNDPAIDLGAVGGTGAGPLQFDGSGNLFYAPGGETKIYKWLASELAAAKLNPTTSPLTLAGHVWHDYSTFLGNPSGYGIGSMTLDGDGDLVAAVVSYTSSSYLLEFGINGVGTYDGTTTTLGADPTRIGEVRNFGGDIMVSTANSIVRVVPEPGSAILLLAGLALISGYRRQR